MSNIEVEKLKQMVSGAKYLEEPLNYFFDMAEAKNFFSKQKTVEDLENNDELMTVLSAIQGETSRFLEKEIEIFNPLIKNYTDTTFYHGVCASSEFPSPIAVIYFSDIQTGVFGFVRQGQTEMFRFIIAKTEDSLNKH
jgi:hypothetical protein